MPPYSGVSLKVRLGGYLLSSALLIKEHQFSKESFSREVNSHSTTPVLHQYPASTQSE